MSDFLQSFIFFILVTKDAASLGDLCSSKSDCRLPLRQHRPGVHWQSETWPQVLSREVCPSRRQSALCDITKDHRFLARLLKRGASEILASLVPCLLEYTGKSDFFFLRKTAPFHSFLFLSAETRIQHDVARFNFSHLHCRQVGLCILCNRHKGVVITAQQSLHSPLTHVAVVVFSSHLFGEPLNAITSAVSIQDNEIHTKGFIATLYFYFIFLVLVFLFVCFFTELLSLGTTALTLFLFKVACLPLLSSTR